MFSKKKYLKIFLICGLSLWLGLGMVSIGNAEQCQCTCTHSGGTTSLGTKPSQADCSSACTTQYGSSATANCSQQQGQGGSSASLTNPLTGNDKAIEGPELYGRVIRALLGFLGIASLVAFIFAGFSFLTAAGSPEQVKKAKDIMLYAVIGIVVCLGSYAILSFIFQALTTQTK